MRFAVTGGRDYDDREAVLSALADLPRDAVLVQGEAAGADSLAREVWSGFLGREQEPHPADWSGPCQLSCAPGHRRRNGSYCPAAGVYRNQEMVDSGLDLVIAFPGGRGTADMVRRSLAAGVKVIDLREDS